MKFWLKIEAFINNLLITLMTVIDALFSKYTPNNIKQRIKNTKQRSLAYREKIKAKALNFKAASHNVIEKSKGQIQDSQAKVKKSVNTIKTINWKAIDYKKIFLVIFAFLAPFFTKIKGWVFTLKPGTIITATITSMSIALTGITIYTQSQQIKEKSKDGEIREPASYSDTMSRDAWKRSEYRNHAQKVLTLSDVSIPIYLEGERGMQTLKMDFSLVADNRYIAQYFTIYENEFVLRDRLNKKMHPIVPTFPMKAEGKKILKEKIVREINLLIKDLKIKGEVKDIYIHSILN